MTLFTRAEEETPESYIEAAIKNLELHIQIIEKQPFEGYLVKLSRYQLTEALKFIQEKNTEGQTR